MEAKQQASEWLTNHRRNQKDVRICIRMNENENMTTKNLWDSVKTVVRGRFRAIQAYLNFTPKANR